ncbi:metal ABC transporter ATP-binding protein [Cellulomonas endophytica]|uniref:metal ABC transporter ATP-binding protein n=1 Tax=Cellulomonas endophytica TaxID=2494735 RepID=UPI001F0C49E5|nr:ATP-binding cassette domain-containing protein [Cellulomonas endophytica]
MIASLPTTARASELSPPGGAALLTLDCCALGYDGRALLSDVDVVVRGCECVTVTGPNGSGKTTLLRAVLGSAQVLDGTVRVGTARLGYVPQRDPLAPVVPATVAEVVGVGRLPLTGPLRRLRPAVRRADRAAVQDALELVGLADRARTPVAQLSGGQQRRVLVARALAAEPELLLLDEPTAGVDALHQRALCEVLARVRDTGVAVLVVTHEPEALRGATTRRLTVADGRVAEAAA